MNLVIVLVVFTAKVFDYLQKGENVVFLHAVMKSAAPFNGDCFKGDHCPNIIGNALFLFS